MRNIYTINFINQKIRVLNLLAELAKEILSWLKKDYIHLRLVKKDTSVFQNNLHGYIRAVRYYGFSLPTYTNPIFSTYINLSFSTYINNFFPIHTKLERLFNNILNREKIIK